MPLGVYTRTAEHKAKLAKVLKPYRLRKGCVAWNKGITYIRGKSKNPMPQERKDRIAQALRGKPSWNKGLTGEKSHVWQGGKTDFINRLRASEQMKQWRSDVFRRDGWTCQTCGLRGHGRDIEAHHIVSIKTILKEASIELVNNDSVFQTVLQLSKLFNVPNGVTLCKDCHIRMHHK